MNQPSLFIRADASSRLGTGHVMRMLALAEAWRKNGKSEVTFLCAELPETLADRVAASGFRVVRLPVDRPPVEDAGHTLQAVGGQEAPSAWLVADGYHFPVDFQRVVKAAGVRLLVMDDNGENGTYVSDLVLNQNIQARAEWYRDRARGTRLLMGTRYALLRSEFIAVCDAEPARPVTTRRVLVTLGGSDPADATGLVLDSLALLERPDAEIVVVVGGSNPRREELERQSLRLRWKSVNVLSGVPDMASLMCDADLAITAGGSTCWELCLLGIPMVALVTADNQRAIVRGLAAAGAAVDAGEVGHQDKQSLAMLVGQLLSDGAHQAALSARARLVVDGRGAERVRDAMLAPEVARDGGRS